MTRQVLGAALISRDSVSQSPVFHHPALSSNTTSFTWHQTVSAQRVQLCSCCPGHILRCQQPPLLPGQACGVSGKSLTSFCLTRAQQDTRLPATLEPVSCLLCPVTRQSRQRTPVRWHFWTTGARGSECLSRNMLWHDHHSGKSLLSLTQPGASDPAGSPAAKLFQGTLRLTISFTAFCCS